MKVKVLMDCWRYGQSHDSGYEPYLKKGQVVEEVGPREDGTTWVKAGERHEKVLIEAIRPVA